MLIENIFVINGFFFEKKKIQNIRTRKYIYIYILFKVMQINKFIFPRSLFIFRINPIKILQELYTRLRHVFKKEQI